MGAVRIRFAGALFTVLQLLCAGSTSASISATPCDGSNFQKGAYEGAKEISNFETQNATACCFACMTTTGCACFTWQDLSSRVAPRQCKLKSSVPSTLSPDAGHISGVCHGVTPPTPPAPPTPPTPPYPAPSPPSPTPPPVIPSSKPNILFVLSDDQDGWLNGYTSGTGIAHMDQLNTRVRRNGTLFTNFYLAYPLCSPSRSAMLTGRYPHNTNFTTNAKLNSSNFHPGQEATTVNTWLQNVGYETMLCGKYLNGYHGSGGHWATYVPVGWDYWFGFQTVDFFGTRVNIQGNSTKFPQEDYQTDIIANLSISWLRHTHNRSKPFFMFVTPHAPHEPYTPAPRHLGTLKGLIQPPDPAFNMADNLQKLLPGNLGRLPLVNVDSMNAIFEKRAESLLAIDEMIGHLLDELEEQGVMQNTFVFYACDNGYHLGQHRMPPGKREIFQHDINVPFIVSGPGIARGSTITATVLNVDLTMTWADIAGATPQTDAPAVDGKSMTSLLFAKKEKWNRTFSLHEGYQSCEAGHGEGGACSHIIPPSNTSTSTAHDEIPLPQAAWKPDGRDYSGLRLKTTTFPDAMYVEYTDGGRAFFNNAVDPWQTTNLYMGLSNQTKTELANLLASVVDCKGSECP